MSGVQGGVPGGHFRTDWRQHDVASMWHTIENQQGDNHWKLVSGWRRTAELTATHLQRLLDYRDKLATVWPPARNAAAAAYVTRLDFLINSVRATHDVAAANYSTFAATVGALTGARRDLKPIYDEYVETHRAIRSYEDLVAHSRSSEGASPTPVRPAAPQDLERLNYRARAIMYDLSRTLVEAQSALKHPSAYLPQMQMEAGNPDVYGSGGRGSAKESSYGSPNGSSRSTSVPLAEQTHGDTYPARSSPAASAARPALRPAALPGTAPPSGRRAPVGLQPSAPATVPPGRASGAPSRHVLSAATVLSPVTRGTEQTRPIPPAGAVIGAPPTAPHPSTNAAQSSRVNPVGGVIGSARPTDPVRPSQGPTNQRTEDVWEVATGVAPVIHPMPLGGPIDPGPVIGLAGR